MPNWRWHKDLHFNSLFLNKLSFPLNLCVLSFYAVNLPSIPQNTPLQIRTNTDPPSCRKLCYHLGTYITDAGYGVLCQTPCLIFSSAIHMVFRDCQQRLRRHCTSQETERLGNTNSVFFPPFYCWLAPGKREAAMVDEGLPRRLTFLKPKSDHMIPFQCLLMNLAWNSQSLQKLLWPLYDLATADFLELIFSHSPPFPFCSCSTVLFPISQASSNSFPPEGICTRWPLSLESSSPQNFMWLAPYYSGPAPMSPPRR